MTLSAEHRPAYLDPPRFDGAHIGARIRGYVDAKATATSPSLAEPRTSLPASSRRALIFSTRPTAGARIANIMLCVLCLRVDRLVLAWRRS